MLTYLKVFLCGGLMCVIGEILIMKTALTPGRILVAYITAGVILSCAGLYEPFAQFALAGATVPLSGFGHLLVQGTLSAVKEKGFLGAFTGGLSSASGGIAAAIFFSVITSLLCRAKPKT